MVVMHLLELKFLGVKTFKFATSCLIEFYFNNYSRLKIVKRPSFYAKPR